ncbi:hypothetical protein EV182_001569 [Spiromyces aspiralis]|uniref:Uncharacterized protein n=1 Tax=Spiromyces aspiralis TaxID=68401 RepID=A0ACC1HX38_9FUNG|nr:hypothetical protein EV182_001569 [Spiromyces aspiralis]
MSIKTQREVVLGYAERPDPGFAGLSFPSKIGGRPIWIDPQHPLRAEDVTCRVCSKPMVLLHQLYAPEDDPPEAFHRMLYVFARIDLLRLRRDSMRVFRAQLPEENELYRSRPVESHEGSGIKEVDDLDYDDDNDNDDIEWVRRDGIEEAQLCVICELGSELRCPSCKVRHYCCRAHLNLDRATYCHGEICGKPLIKPIKALITNATHNIAKFVYPELEIMSETEVLKYNSEDSDDESEATEAVDKHALVPVSSEKAEDSEVDVDKEFLLFQRRVSQNPSQVIRYARTRLDDGDDDKEGAPEPLWVNEQHKPRKEDIPACEFCGASREFEFQVMPQMLGYLGIDFTSRTALDWGTLLIYTCPNSCALPEGTHYAREFIWRQNYSSKGIGDRYIKAATGNLDPDELVSKQFDNLDI